MSGRRASLTRLLTESVPPAAREPAATPVRAMGLMVGEPGERVVDVDPALCDPAFVRDRLDAGADVDGLTRNIELAGQAVPVLLRPHPHRPGRYEIAYGHRRVRAVKALGRPVKAIIRTMDDAALVVAQGRENSDRQDVTFIERALFAAALVAKDFSRPTVAEALGIDKTELARLLKVAKALPEGLAVLIGPAPRTGRPRWMRLASALQDGNAGAAKAALGAAKASAALPSDARFAAVLESVVALTEAPPTRAPPVSVRITKQKTVITVDNEEAPGFGDFLAGELDRLHRAFEKKRSR